MAEQSRRGLARDDGKGVRLYGATKAEHNVMEKSMAAIAGQQVVVHVIMHTIFTVYYIYRNGMVGIPSILWDPRETGDIGRKVAKSNSK